jgi:hypothetical protein
MSIDVRSEKLITPIEAVYLFPKRNEPSPRSIRRWIAQKKLDGFLLAGAYVTSEQAVYRFLDKLAKGEI